jgi:hypothetical protein
MKREEMTMTVDRLLLAFAGGLILVGVLLAVIHSLYWLFFTAFVGANLLQSAFTGFCPAAALFKKLGVKTGAAFN